MQGYVKLFSSILSSSVWREDSATRIVWVTLLAMADRHGEVSAAIPGLAHMAGVTLAECEIALARFQAPDPYSRTQEHDGRRIVKVDGGWALLNYGKYREKMRGVERQEYNRRIKQESRARARSPPAAVEPGLFDAPAAAPPRPRVGSHNLADLRLIHPRLLIRDADVERAEGILALYSWDVLMATIPKVPGGTNGKVLVGMLADYLAANVRLASEDYTRAGLPIPDGTPTQADLDSMPASHKG